MLHFYDGQIRKFMTQFIRVMSNFSIELGKGKNSIELENEAAILPTLEVIKKAVEAGELDDAITAVSKAVLLNLN